MSLPSATVHESHAPPSPPSSPTPSVVGWVVASPWRLLATGAAAVALVEAGGADEGPGLCLVRRCTGAWCPGCGSTRAARHLLRGDVGAAWADHPWVVLVVAQALVVALVAVASARARAALRRATTRPLVAVLGANVVLALVVWAVRLIDGSIPGFG